MSENETTSNVSPVNVQPSKRPRPLVRKVDRGSQELTWTPESIELFSVVNGANVRAGEAYAIVRPGQERWPLGIASDHYKPTDHVATDARILSECSESLTPNGVVMSGHGYNVAYGYFIRHMQASKVGAHDVTTKLVVAHDHTGKGSMVASMCLYVDNQAIGAIVTTKAMHVAAQPGIWQSNIDAMIESAIIAQDAVLEMLAAAEAYVLTDEDKAFLAKKGMRVPEGVTTALGALVAHHKGRNARITWGVWERRMNDEGIRAVLKLLKPEIAETLNETLRSRRLSCVPQRKAA